MASGAARLQRSRIRRGWPDGISGATEAPTPRIEQPHVLRSAAGHFALRAAGEPGALEARKPRPIVSRSGGRHAQGQGAGEAKSDSSRRRCVRPTANLHLVHVRGSTSSSISRGAPHLGRLHDLRLLLDVVVDLVRRAGADDDLLVHPIGRLQHGLLRRLLAQDAAPRSRRRRGRL